MGIGSVAVYSKADQDSLHVERADEAVYIGDGTAKETYLDTKKIIKAALDTGAKAIHPGYGFLRRIQILQKNVRRTALSSLDRILNRSSYSV